MRVGSLFLLWAFLLAGLFSCNPGPIPKDRPTDYDAVVIGAGMGGLSAGVHLAKGGLKVLVLEQHHKVGGCTSSFDRGNYHFETALHEMDGAGENGPIRKLLDEAGVLDKIQLIPIENLYRSVMPGVDFTYPVGLDKAVQAMVKTWPEEKDGIERFHKLMKQLYDDSQELSDLYRYSPVRKALTLALTPIRQWSMVRHMRSTAQDILDAHFKDERLKAVAGQLWVYYGPTPKRLWGPLFMLANGSYLMHGAWHIKGSSQVLSNAYAERIQELGGVVKTGNRVAKILVENGQVRGVVTELGETFTSRYVVSNADPYQTYFRLVGEDKTPEDVKSALKKLKPSNSLFGVYLGLDVEPSFWNIKDHEIFYNSSLDADENYKGMMEGRYADSAAAITFYSNLGDPWYAPAGKSVLVLHAYGDIKIWPDDRDAYQQMKEQKGDELVALVEKFLPGLASHIVVKEVVTPRTIQTFTGHTGGIPYGFDFTVDQPMMDRPPNESAIDGLYLAGSWSQPSHGVSAAQISGYQAARLILDREGKP